MPRPSASPPPSSRRQRLSLSSAEIGVALVAANEATAQQLLDEVLRLADNEGEAVVLGWEPQILEEGA